jgi:hypothetical protein
MLIGEYVMRLQISQLLRTTINLNQLSMKVEYFKTITIMKPIDNSTISFYVLKFILYNNIFKVKNEDSHLIGIVFKELICISSVFFFFCVVMIWVQNFTTVSDN